MFCVSYPLHSLVSDIDLAFLRFGVPATAYSSDAWSNMYSNYSKSTYAGKHSFSMYFRIRVYSGIKTKKQTSLL
jgi:hypothetical protein